MGGLFSSGVGSNHFLPIPKEDYRILVNTTNFKKTELDYLYIRFRKLGAPGGRTKFIYRRDFHFSSSDVHFLLLNEMFGEEIRLTFVKFVKFLNIFRPPRSSRSSWQDGYRTVKLRLIFDMYDTSKDGVLSKYELLDVVHRLFSIRYMNIKTMVKIVDRMMEEMQKPDANYITFDDFCKAMEGFDMDLLALSFPHHHM